MQETDLLTTYARTRDQDAFAQLVRLHGHWVCSAARRQLGDEHLAEDVTQAVFVLLARKAGHLQRYRYLSGWLFHTLRYCVNEARRQRFRQQKRELEAARMRSEAIPQEAGWHELAPVLDQALSALGEKDRQPILLRFYQQMSMAEVGTAMSISEDAAKKRVQRSLEKLRGVLTRKGVTAGAALAAVLSDHVTEAAPAALLDSATGAGQGGSTGAVGAITKGAVKMMIWAKVKVAAMIAGLTLAVTAAGVLGVSQTQKDSPRTIVPTASPAPLTAASTSPAATQATQDNAATLYRQAWALLPQSGGDQQAISDWDTTPLNATTTSLLKRYQASLDLTRRAAAVPSADWQMPYTVAGMGKFLWETSGLRELCYLSLLDARVALLQHREADAVADVAASLALGRHVSAEPVLVSRLVSIAISARTIDFTAAHLPELSPQALRDLKTRMDRLPHMTTATDMVRAERKYAVASLEEQGLGPMAEQLAGFYDELTKAVALPPDQFEAEQQRLSQKAKESRQLAGILLPSFSKAMETDRRGQAHEAMFRTAIEVQLNGPTAVKASHDPFGDGPFEYRQLSNGFELRSKLVYKGEPAALTVGQDTPRK